MARVLGIDLGSRRIGVAVSDGLGLTAQPRTTLARHGGMRDMESIAKAVKEADADRIVVGLPLDPEGKEGPAAAQAMMSMTGSIMKYWTMRQQTRMR